MDKTILKSFIKDIADGHINEGSFDGGDRDGKGKKWEDYDTITCLDGTVIDMKRLRLEQGLAMSALAKFVPFFAPFLSQLKFVYTFRVKTQATDGNYIYINPQFTATLDKPGDITWKAFVMAHEVMHCVLNHFSRTKSHGYDMHKGNIAADYECNIILADTKKGASGGNIWKVSDIHNFGVYIDEKYRGWAFERIYDDIKSDNSYGDMSNDADGQQSGGQGQQSGGGGGNQQQQKSPDYIAGWEQAIKDYKNGKIKI